MGYYTDIARMQTWWIEEGKPVPAGLIPITQEEAAQIPPPTVQTPAEIQAAYVQAAQSLLDTTAQSRGYDGILSLCSYATSTNARFAAEGQAGVAWRDAVWATGYEVLGAVQAGQMAPPSLEDFLAMLPPIVW